MEQQREERVKICRRAFPSGNWSAAPCRGGLFAMSFVSMAADCGKKKYHFFYFYSIIIKKTQQKQKAPNTDFFCSQWR